MDAAELGELARVGVIFVVAAFAFDEVAAAAAAAAAAGVAAASEIESLK